MKKYTIDELKKKCELLEWIIVHASVKKDKDVNKVFPKFPEDGKWEIKLIVQDVELPIIETFIDLDKEMDRIVKKRALEIIDDEIGNLEDFFEEIIHSIQSKLFKKINDRFK